MKHSGASDFSAFYCASANTQFAQSKREQESILRTERMVLLSLSLSLILLAAPFATTAHAEVKQSGRARECVCPVLFKADALQEQSFHDWAKCARAVGCDLLASGADRRTDAQREQARGWLLKNSSSRFWYHDSLQVCLFFSSSLALSARERVVARDQAARQRLNCRN